MGLNNTKNIFTKVSLFFYTERRYSIFLRKITVLNFTVLQKTQLKTNCSFNPIVFCVTLSVQKNEMVKIRMEEEILKQKVQKWIISISTLILLGKFIAYWMTHSVGILTDALESIVNVTAGVISLFSLRYAAQPKDKEHPFGHGKMELISASIEGIMITIAGGFIIYEGMKRLFLPEPIQKLDIGIYIIAVSGLLNYMMGWYSVRMGRRYNSMALVAGGKHLQSDTYSTIGLIIGLLLLYMTHIAWIDSALALVFGMIIIVTGISILRKTTDNLLDHADEELLKELADQINKARSDEWIDIHNVKVIKSGSFLYLDCDLTIPWYYNIEHGHELGKQLHDVLSKQLAQKLQMTIHLDPCNIFDVPRCHACGLKQCPHRRENFKQLEEISLTQLTSNQADKGD